MILLLDVVGQQNIKYTDPPFPVSLHPVVVRSVLHCYRLVRKHLPACHIQVLQHYSMTNHRIATVLERKLTSYKNTRPDLIASRQDEKSLSAELISSQQYKLGIQQDKV